MNLNFVFLRLASIRTAFCIVGRLAVSIVDESIERAVLVIFPVNSYTNGRVQLEV